MATKQDFLDKQAKFNETWGINVSIEPLETGIRKIAQLKNFTLEQKNAAANTYANLFSYVLAGYLKQHSHITENAAYNKMHDFSADTFLNQFEDLMATKFEAANKNGSTRKPFEGIDRNRFITFANNMVNSYNKSLPEVWADRIKKGTMTIEEMQAITDNAQNLLMVQNKRPGYMPENKKAALLNMVAAYNAMETLRQQRSVWWRFWNFRISGREQKYLDKLKEQVNALRNTHYKVSAALGSANQKLMEQPKGDKITLDSIPVGEAELVLDNVASKLESTINNRQYVREFSEKIFAAIPNGKKLVNGKEQEFSSLLSATMELVMQNYNKTYDSTQAKDLDPEITVKAQMKLAFADAVTSFTNIIGYENRKERLVAAQIITDMIMKEFSPARFQPEKYGKYASGYALNNWTEIEELANEDPKDIEAALVEYNKIVANKAKENEVNEKPIEEHNIINDDKKVEESKELRQKIDNIDLGDKIVTETSAFVSEPKFQELTKEIN